MKNLAELGAEILLSVCDYADKERGIKKIAAATAVMILSVPVVALLDIVWQMDHGGPHER